MKVIQNKQEPEHLFCQPKTPRFEQTDSQCPTHNYDDDDDDDDVVFFHFLNAFSFSTTSFIFHLKPVV